jgi:enoyl-CoA hydratase
MKFQNTLLDFPAKAVARVRIDRPEKRNALNAETIEELHQLFLRLKADVSVRVVLLTGSGEKAFVAGADISEFADFSSQQGMDLARQGQAKLFDMIAHFPKPVVCMINGFALGGGLELAMACHLRWASKNAKMGLPEVSLGLIPGYGGTQRLPQLIGKGRAFELILTGGMISAQKALEMGLVNAVVSSEALLSSCLELATKLLANSPQAIRAAICAINAGYAEGIDGFGKEIELFGTCFGTDDFVEGTQAFLQKRPP